MELLGKRERYQEAEEYYQQLPTALEQDGQEQDPDPRTQDLREYLRAKQLSRSSRHASSAVAYDVHTDGSPLFGPLLVSVVQSSQTQQMPLDETVPVQSGVSFPLALSLSTLSLETESVDLATSFGIRVNELKAIGTFWYGSTITCQQQQAFIYTELKKWSVMADQDQHLTNEYLVSRRTALATLATLSTSLLAKIQLDPLTFGVIEEFLSQCATSITTCWHLMQGREFAIVQQVLTRYLPIVSTWAKHPSSYQKTSAYLASQGCLLMGLLSLHSLPLPQNFQRRVLYCTQATEYARFSADPDLLITALAHLGNAHYDMGHLDAMLQTYQQAVFTIDDLSKQHQFSSLLRSKLQVELAHAHAQQGHVQESLRALKEARILFPDESEVTPVFLSTDYGHHSLILFEGLTHLDLETYAPGNNHSRQASEALAQAETVSTGEPIPERFRIEIINQRALVAIKEGKLEDFRHYLLEGIQGAKALRSEKRRQEAIAHWKAAREQ